MKKCSENCMPECDFCIHCEHEKIEYNDGFSNGEPIYCNLHKINFEEESWPFLSPCEDFHCFLAK